MLVRAAAMLPPDVLQSINRLIRLSAYTQQAGSSGGSCALQELCCRTAPATCTTASHCLASAFQPECWCFVRFLCSACRSSPDSCGVRTSTQTTQTWWRCCCTWATTPPTTQPATRLWRASTHRLRCCRPRSSTPPASVMQCAAGAGSPR